MLFLQINEENENFSSKRKKELLDYLKKPFYLETLIRIKLPDKTIWEGKFSPKDVLKTVFDVFHLVKKKKILFFFKKNTC